MISVIIPSYNRIDKLKQLLTSIFGQNGTVFEVVVVDDCSSDGSADMVTNFFPMAHLIRFNENRGPAIARNEGIRASRGNIVVGLDSDVILPDSNWLQNVADLFENRPELMCAAFRIMNKYTRKHDELRWWHPLPLDRYGDRPFFSDYFSGTGHAFRRNVFEIAGYYPEDLFMYMEENDFALRILDAGIDIRYSPEVTVIHDVYRFRNNPRYAFYYKRRNQIWVAFRYLPWWRIPIYLVPRVFKTLVLSLIRGYSAMYFRALWDAVCGMRDVLKTRRPIKSTTLRRIRRIRSGSYPVREA